MTDVRYYFSRIRLKGDSADVRALARLAASDAYREHRMVWQFFASDPNAQRDFIYRREAGQGGDRPLTYFLVSQRPPVADAALWSIDTKPYAPQIEAGDRFEFSLRANPVVHRKAERSPEDEAAWLARRDADGRPAPKDTRSRKRDDVVFVAKQKFKQALGNAWREEYDSREIENTAGFAWLEGQGQRFGFTVAEGDVSVSGYQQERFTTRNGHRTQFSRLDFAGQLAVTDPDAFRSAAYSGIGPAKAFGCGLLLLRRIG